MNKDQLDGFLDFAKEKLGFAFSDINLLVTALTHRSYVNEHKASAGEHNERLEFLGDAVLELAVTDFLFRNYKNPEGVLTAWRAALVRTESIGEAGEKLGYPPLIRMSKGERNGSERARQTIIADAFEALIGAIYLDQGYEAARKFIEENILVKFQAILDSESWRDPKSHLQELSQKLDGQTPNYKVLKEEGPDHDKLFTVGAFVGNKIVGSGQGSSKQIAEQMAATQGVKLYKKQLGERKAIEKTGSKNHDGAKN
ncbi:MAG: ribonuclease III [Candidatus Nomurabacteria bacterium]|jgi:ribonuclease-3|nr:ribonuclease III [Candidatus Nomurabacteria bacterium]